MDQNEKKLIGVLQSVLKQEEELSMQTDLEGTGKWDSLAMLTLAAALNKEFSIRLSFQNLKSIKVPKDILNYINNGK